MEKILFTPHDIESRVFDFAEKLNKEYQNTFQNPPVLTPILQGGITFFQDISKNILFDAYVDCVGVESYKKQERGEINLYKDWRVDLTGRDVWLIDDIADSGNTMNYLEKLAYDKGANFVGKAVLLKRHDCPIELDWHGFEIQDEWVFGYGMDHPDGLGRLSDSIFKV